MEADNVRLNITLPRDVARRLDMFAEPRKRSRFISEAIRRRIKQIEEQELERLLEEGYRAGRKESLSLAKEFEAIDLEGWHEY
jgi:metal-responsive CopG/Arc/MetJ family transcriptional regulator